MADEEDGLCLGFKVSQFPAGKPRTLRFPAEPSGSVVGKSNKTFKKECPLDNPKNVITHLTLQWCSVKSPRQGISIR